MFCRLNSLAETCYNIFHHVKFSVMKYMYAKILKILNALAEYRLLEKCSCQLMLKLRNIDHILTVKSISLPNLEIGSRWVRPVGRGCLLLLDSCHTSDVSSGSCLAILWFVLKTGLMILITVIYVIWVRKSGFSKPFVPKCSPYKTLSKFKRTHFILIRI
jgi:hypothetical protein